MVSNIRVIWLALMLLSSALWTSPANAQAGLVGRPIATCVRAVAAGDSVRKLLKAPTGFDCTTPQREFGQGDFWIITPLIPGSSGDAPFRVRHASTWFSALSLYALHADGSISGTLNDDVGITQHIKLGAIIEHQFAIAPTPVVRLLWRVDGALNVRGLVMGARLSKIEESDHADMILAALYSGFAGLCIALIAYNLALWAALRYDFQLAYCLMLFCLLLYSVTSSGALARLVPTMQNTDRITLNYLLLAWALSAALGFCRLFFEPRIFEGWVGRGINVAILVFAVLGAGFLLFPAGAIHMLDRAYAVCFAALPIVIIPILWRAWRRRSNYLWFYAVTWAAPMAMVTARGLHNLGLIPWNFWLYNSALFVMAAEALFTSLAIAYRIRLLRGERDEAVRLEAVSRELADTDPLTGLLNRRAFLTQAIGSGDDNMLMLLDIDHFKQVNETIGHDGGDDVLRIFARTLRQQVPPEVLVARLGGEEFALLGPSSLLPDADRLLATIRTQRMPFDLRVTTSIGTCLGPLRTEHDWKRLYRHADRALFQAKAAGRDRAEHASPLAPSAEVSPARPSRLQPAASLLTPM